MKMPLLASAMLASSHISFCGQGSGQNVGQEGNPGSGGSWRCDYNLPSGQLTGMGQRSVSASNLAAMNLPHGEWLGGQDQREPFHPSSLPCAPWAPILDLLYHQPPSLKLRDVKEVVDISDPQHPHACQAATETAIISHDGDT